MNRIHLWTATILAVTTVAASLVGVPVAAGTAGSPSAAVRPAGANVVRAAAATANAVGDLDGPA